MSNRNDRSDRQSTYQNANADSDNRGRRPGRRWLYALLAIVTLVLFLPNIVTMLGLQQQAVNMFAGDIDGELKIGRMTAGWFQPVTIRNVSLFDRDGQAVLSIAEIKSSRRLWSLLRTDDYGHFDIKQPVVSLHLKKNGSNLEDVLAAFITPEKPDASLQPTPTGNGSTPAPTPLPKVSLRVIDGAATLTSETSREAWSIDQLEAAVQLVTDHAAGETALQCRVTEFSPDAGGTQIPQSSGNLSLSAEIDGGQPDADHTKLKFASVQANVDSSQLPLSIISPLAERFIGAMEVRGNLDCQLAAACDLTATTIAADVAKLNVSQLQIASPELLGTDRFQIRNALATGKINLSPQTLSADAFEFRTDVGYLQANGNFGFAQLNSAAAGTQLPGGDFRMDGELDLASLMKMLPATFHTHEDLQVETGSANFHVRSRQRQLMLNLDLANLKARRSGQEIVWREPVRVVADVSDASGQLMLKNFQCLTDFITVQGNAGFTEGVFEVKGDLAMLTKRIGQFVDLQQMETGGTLDGKFGWQLKPGSQLNLGGATGVQPIDVIGNFAIDQPLIRMPGVADWKPGSAVLQISAALQAFDAGRIQVDSAAAKAVIGREQMLLTLAAPIADAASNEVWNFQAQAVGDVGGYLKHAQNFVDLGPIAAAGNLDFQSGVSVTRTEIGFSNATVAIDQFAFEGYSVIVRENRVTANVNGRYDLNTGVIGIAQTSLSSSGVSASGQNLTIVVADNIQINGDTAFRADISRVADWLQLSPGDDDVFYLGDAQGTLRLVSDDAGIGGLLDMKVTDLAAAMKQTLTAGNRQPFQQVAAKASLVPFWSEANVGIRGGLKLANDFDGIALDKMQLQSKTLTATTTGSIVEMSGPMLMNLSGVWNPQWDLVNSLLDVYTGRTVRLRGTGEQPFLVRGPIFETDPSQPSPPFLPAQFQASTRVAWADGQVLDLPIGEGLVEVIVDQGVVSTTVHPVSFSGGQIKANPKVDLRSAEPVLYLDRHRLMDRVQLTPETCASLLKYVNPLAAGATQAQGTFSVDSDGVQVPLYDPMKMEARAVVVLEDVVVSAGPMAQQLIGIVQQVRSVVKPEGDPNRDYGTWLKMSQQSIPVAVKNGRVYHEGIRMSHDDVTLSTTGSVGLDQTLDMVAEIPIPDAWLARSKYLAGLKGKSISIPIGGTVSQPKLDRDAVRQFTTQIARDLAGNAINQAITDKVAPELTKVQNELNEKIGGEINKVQNKLQTELQDRFQNQVKDRLQQNLGGELQQQLQGKLGDVFKLPASNAAPARPGVTPPKENLEEELIRGIGNLFK